MDVASKINGVGTAPVGAGGAVQRPRDATTSSTQGSHSSSGDGSGNVHITGKASQLAALEQALLEMPAVDEARVAAVREAIEQGRYQISPEKIANQLLALESALSQLPGEK